MMLSWFVALHVLDFGGLLVTGITQSDSIFLHGGSDFLAWWFLLYAVVDAILRARELARVQNKKAGALVAACTCNFVLPFVGLTNVPTNTS